MEKETKDFLEFVDRKLSTESISIHDWKSYIENLPIIYQQDISFRLLFNWHYDLKYSWGEAGSKNTNHNLESPLFSKQIEIIDRFSHSLNSNYQVRELIYYHARVNLKGKKLLEVGGVSPNQLLFDLFGVYEYTNIESPDYINEKDGINYSDKFKPHDKKKTIFCNAEELNLNLEKESQDLIFSVACFEHIYDLEKALHSCWECLSSNSYLYSYFAPIYSQLNQGDHGVIPEHKSFKQKPIGLHLLSQSDQRKKLIEAGITNPKEIQSFLANVNFNRIPNRLHYEDYERILTESPFWVMELKRLDWFNISKAYTSNVKEIRKSNPSVGNVMTMGFRTLLLKR